EPTDAASGGGQSRSHNLRDACQLLIVNFCHSLPARHDGFNPLELLRSQSTVHFGEAIAKPDLCLLVPIERRVASLVAQTTGVVGEVSAVGCKNSAFSGGDLLVRVESQNGDMSEGSGFAGAEFGAQRLAGVFDQIKSAAVGKVAQSCRVHRAAEGVNGDNRPGPRGYGGFDKFRRGIERGGININKSGAKFFLQQNVERGGEREGRQNYFRSSRKIEDTQSQMKGGGSGVDGDRMVNLQIASNRVFKFSQLWAEAEVGRAEYLQDGFAVGIGDFRTGERDAEFCHAGFIYWWHLSVHRARLNKSLEPKSVAANTFVIRCEARPSP